MKTGKKVGFAGLAREVSARWKAIDPALKAHYDGLAATEKALHAKKKNAWKKQKKTLEAKRTVMESTPSSAASLAVEYLDEFQPEPIEFPPSTSCGSTATSECSSFTEPPDAYSPYAVFQYESAEEEMQQGYWGYPGTDYTAQAMGSESFQPLVPNSFQDEHQYNFLI